MIVKEEDMRQLIFVLTFLTKEYYEALPKRDSTTEYPERMTLEEAKRSIDEIRYVCESARLMYVQSVLFRGPFFSYDAEKMGKKIEAIKEKAKHVSEEEMLQKIVDAQTKDPWIPEIGASVSTTRRFEELMGEYTEITAVLEKHKSRNHLLKTKRN